MVDPEYAPLRRHLTTALREMKRAVDRSAEVDLRPGHIAEAQRRTRDIRDAANELVERLKNMENKN